MNRMRSVFRNMVSGVSVLRLAMAFFLLMIQTGNAQRGKVQVNVGVVLDLDLVISKMSLRCINMSLSDFYATHSNYTTRLAVDVQNSNGNVVGAASAALHLIKNKEVQAILGPVSSTQAHFLINLGNQSQVPIISFSATSPSLTSLRSPYFIRATHNDSSQVKAISAIIRIFKWREVVPMYVDNEFGEGIVPYLIDAFQEINVRIRNRSVISPVASDDQITQELYKLMTMPTRVFIVHMLAPLASRIFAKAKEIGMMNQGYVWIVTNGIADLMTMLDDSGLETMQGVLGVKTHVPNSIKMTSFTARWRKKFPDSELNNYCYWAYDAITALAMAVERVGNGNFSFDRTKDSNGTDLEDLGVSNSGPRLLQELAGVKFQGLAGDFLLQNGQREVSTFKIINVEDHGERTVGFWTPRKGLVKSLSSEGNIVGPDWKSYLRSIIWPGDTTTIPKGWEIPTNSKKLRIAVPKKEGFNEFVQVTRDRITNRTTVTGFCIDVFDAVINKMTYAVPYEYIPFVTPDGKSAGTYDEMVYKVFLGEFDAAVGDTTIVVNRSTYVDFALPYSETGVAFVVPVKDKKEKSPWTFSKPMTLGLWMATAGTFIYIALLVWVFEHKHPEITNLSKLNQVIATLWFSFSMLFFSHREPVHHVCTRILVLLWCFVVLILTQSYTASLASLLTVQQLQPTVTSINNLIKSKENIGCQTGSFVFEKLKRMGIDESRLIIYSTPEEMHELLLNGTSRGGIAAAVDEVPYIRLFLSQYCSQYTMIEPKFKADGFGFAFPIGSPLVPDVSRAVLNVTEGEKMNEIENAWFKKRAVCPDFANLDSSSQLDLKSFEALFLIVLGVSLLLLSIFLIHARFFAAANEPPGPAANEPPGPAAHQPPAPAANQPNQAVIQLGPAANQPNQAAIQLVRL